MANTAMLQKLADVFTAKSPVGHWWYQRVSALALVPLSLWLIAFFNQALHAPYRETVLWLSAPANALAVLAWTLAAVYHAALGVQVIVEDYVSTLSIRHAVIRISNGLFLVVGIAALAAIVFILTTR
jgi:succinate dehydrogenase / fumarate reductase membrane anchor subunit